MNESRKERRAKARLERKRAGVTSANPIKNRSIFSRTIWWAASAIALFFFCIAAILIIHRNQSPKGIVSETVPPLMEHPPQSKPTSQPPIPGKRTLERLLELPAEELGQEDIAEMNLLCAQGLSGGENIDISKALPVLDDWAETARRSIEQNSHRFKENPSEYRNSESLFKMIMLVLTLQQDLKVHYDPSMMGTAIFSGNTEAIKRDLADESYFRDSQSVFLHGILSEDRRGTCSSMPVLYVAVGRRLGFPLKLVTAKGHLFVRWEGNGERFNIEGTGVGVDSPSDEDYMKGPLPISREEVDKGLYLKSLSPSEELAVFLENRALCLKVNKRKDEALVAFAQANRLRPRHDNTEIGLAKLVDAVTSTLPAERKLLSKEQFAKMGEEQQEANISEMIAREHLRLQQMSAGRTSPNLPPLPPLPVLPSGLLPSNLPGSSQNIGHSFQYPNLPPTPR